MRQTNRNRTKCVARVAVRQSGPLRTRASGRRHHGRKGGTGAAGSETRASQGNGSAGSLLTGFQGRGNPILPPRIPNPLEGV